MELLVKATVVLLAAWGVARLMSRASAAARCAAWASALGFVLALPVLVAIVPAWSLDLSPIRPVVGGVVADLGLDELSVLRREPAPAAPLADPEGHTNRFVRVYDGVARLAGLGLPAAAAGWLLGTLLMLVRLGYGLLMVRRITASAQPLQDAEWTELVAQACRQLGLRRAPSILVSERVGLPAVSGVLRPALLLPSAYRQWSPSCRRVVVMHELAHIRRRDCLVQLLSECASALYWFHPLVHRASARLRDEREQACDDVVLQAGTAPAAYADHLLDLVRDTIAIPPVPAVAFGMPSRLNQRIGAILNEDRRRTAPKARTVAAAVLACSIAVAALGGARLLAQSAASGAQPDHGGGAITRLITAETRQRVADALVVALRDGEEDIRGIASETIAAIRAQAGPQANMRVLIPCGGNCVNWLGGPPVLQQLVHLLADESAIGQMTSDDVEVRRAAVWKVWPRTERAAAALAALLLDEDRAVRNAAAIRLDSVHAPVAVPNWIVVLGDPDPMLRERAAISLGVIGDDRAIEPLRGALSDTEASVRRQAARALAAIAFPRGGTPMEMAVTLR